MYPRKIDWFRIETRDNPRTTSRWEKPDQGTYQTFLCHTGLKTKTFNYFLAFSFPFKTARAPGRELQIGLAEFKIRLNFRRYSDYFKDSCFPEGHWRLLMNIDSGSGVVAPSSAETLLSKTSLNPLQSSKQTNKVCCYLCVMCICLPNRNFWDPLPTFNW